MRETPLIPAVSGEAQRLLALMEEYANHPDVTFEVIKRGGRIVDVKATVFHQKDVRGWGASGMPGAGEESGPYGRKGS